MHKDIEKYAASIEGVKYGQISAYQAARQSGKSQLHAELIAHNYHNGLLADGWLPVKCSEYFLNNWSQCHDRCREMFGKNYTWTGDIFWFKIKEDIMIFKLTFGA